MKVRARNMKGLRLCLATSERHIRVNDYHGYLYINDLKNVFPANITASGTHKTLYTNVCKFFGRTAETHHFKVILWQGWNIMRN